MFLFDQNNDGPIIMSRCAAPRACPDLSIIYKYHDAPHLWLFLTFQDQDHLKGLPKPKPFRSNLGLWVGT
jgi:hypothetical protein